MKHLLLIAAAGVAAIAGSDVSAQTASPSASPSAPAPVPAGQTAAKPTSHTPVEQLMAVPATRALVEKYFPGIEENPLYEPLKTKSLREISAISQGAIPAATLDKLDADLAALP